MRPGRSPHESTWAVSVLEKNLRDHRTHPQVTPHEDKDPFDDGEEYNESQQYATSQINDRTAMRDNLIQKNTPSNLRSLQLMKGATLRVLNTKCKTRRQQEVQETLAHFRKVLQEPWWLLFPDAKWMTRWDILIFLTLVFTAIATPFEVAILDVKYWDWLFVANRIVDLVFLLDMIKSFFTAYRDKKLGHKWVKDIHKIRRNYLCGWFLIDAISILPYDLMGDDATKELKALRILRVIRLLKLLRVMKASSFFQRYEASMSIPSGNVIFIKHLLYLVIFGHWTSCLWIMLAQIQHYSETTWIDAFAIAFHGADGLESGQWRFNCETNCEDKYRLKEAADECSASCNVLTSIEIYSGASYWSIVSITSVGYGDITPQNTYEMLLTTIYVILAAFFWAWIIGTMSAIITTSDPTSIVHKQTMDMLNLFMEEKNFPETLRRRLRTYFKHNKDLAKNEMHQQLISKMSPILQSEVQDRNGSWIKKLSIFNDQKLSREFVGGACNLLSGTVYEPHENIPWDNQLFCVSQGVASRKGKIRTAGTFWGEDFILECDAMKEKHDGHALTFVEVLVLTRTDFFHLLEGFTDEAAMVRKAVVKMAVKRGILAGAKLILDKKIFEETGEHPKESMLDVIMRGGKHHAAVKPQESMRHLIQKQSVKIAKFEARLDTLAEKQDKYNDTISEKQDKLLKCLSHMMKKIDGGVALECASLAPSLEDNDLVL